MPIAEKVLQQQDLVDVDRRGQMLINQVLAERVGFRTHDTLASMPHFECGAFNHSTTSPSQLNTGDFMGSSVLAFFLGTIGD